MNGVLAQRRDMYENPNTANLNLQLGYTIQKMLQKYKYKYPD